MTEDTDVTILEPDAQMAGLKKGVKYLAQVNNVESWGVFVSLTPDSGSGITGLIHESSLPALHSPRDFSFGDRVVVTVKEFKEGGDISFNVEYGEAIDSGEQGSIPDRDIIDTSRAHGSSGPTLPPGAEDTAQTLERIESMLEEISEDVEGMSGGGRFSNEPAFDAFKTVNYLRNEDYEVSRYNKSTSEEGEIVTLEITFVEEDRNSGSDD
jgi:hypothetical protein